MSELVERLRGTYSTGPFGKRDFAPYIPAIQIEAAARIEELEAALRAVSHVKPCGYVDGMDPLEQAQHYARQVLGKQEDN